MRSLGPLLLLLLSITAVVDASFGYDPHHLSDNDALRIRNSVSTFKIEEKRTKREVSYKPSLFSEEDEYDEDDEEIMGSLFTQFLADSESQLVLDLDFFTQFFKFADKYRESLEEGDIDISKYLIKIVNKIKEFDVSVPCVSDLAYLAWTGFEYATQIKEAKNCTICKCDHFFQKNTNERQWIFNVLDAIGKVPPGIMDGNNLWVGSWNTCRKIHVVKNNQGQEWRGQYCLAHIEAYQKDNPFKGMAGDAVAVDHHCYNNVSTESEANDGKCFQLFPILNFAVCMPDTCTGYDTTQIITFLVRMAESAMKKDLVCGVSVECREEKKENAMSENRLAMFALYLLIFVIVMMLFGTLYDLLIYQHALESLSPSEANEYKTKTHTFIKIVLAYSIYTNAREILNSEVREADIGCLHGVRFLSMCWIILGHTYYYIGTSLTTDNLIPTLVNFPKMFYTQIIVQAPLAVDSFFFLSGLLASYLFFKKLIKDKKVNIKNPLTWLMIYVKRYTRITPTYAVIMLFDVTLFTYVSYGPFWRPIEKQGCRISWWTNFLYLNNFLLQDQECCMGWTWYLANDVQLHYVVGTMLLVAFATRMKWGLYLSGALVILSSVIKLFIIFINDFPPAPILTTKLQIVFKLDAYWNDVYIRPYVRCGPFIVGVVVGYLLIHFTKDKSNIKISMQRKHVIYGWVASTVLGIYSVFGLYWYAITGDISDFTRAFYVLFGRLSYALALGWITFACATGNGGPVNTFLSWKFFIPLSKLTFCAYLLHPIMLQIYNLSRPQPFHFTTFLQMLRHTVEAIIVSYSAAFFFALAFEKPFTVFDEMIIPIKARPQSKAPRKNTKIEESSEDDVEMQPFLPSLGIQKVPIEEVDDNEEHYRTVQEVPEINGKEAPEANGKVPIASRENSREEDDVAESENSQNEKKLLQKKLDSEDSSEESVRHYDEQSSSSDTSTKEDSEDHDDVKA